MAPPRPVWRDDRSCRLLEGAWLGLRVGLYEAIRRDRQREELSVRALARGMGCIDARCGRRWPRRCRRPRQRRWQSGAQVRSGQAVDRCDAARGPERAAQAASYRAAGAGPAGRRAPDSRCRIPRCGTTSPSVGRRSTRRPAGPLRRGSSRRPISRALRPRSISLICGSICAGCGRRCSCSRCGCPASGRAVHKVFAHPGSGGVPGRPSVMRSTELGGVPVRQDPLRQPQVRGIASLVRDATGPSPTGGCCSVRTTGFDAFYCQPGVDGAHEKGGVEGEGGRFRRTHLVPVPQGGQPGRAERPAGRPRTAPMTHRRITNRVRTVGEDFAPEAPLLRPLPVERFETGPESEAAGGPVRQDHGAPVPRTRCRPGSSAAGSGCCCAPMR